MNTTILLLLILGISLCECRRIQFFRRDYKHIPAYDAYYKLHEQASNWTSALLKCDSEGASLFYPSDDQEISSVWANLDDDIHLKENYEIYVGFHNTFNMGKYITVDGNVTPMPLSRISEEGNEENNDGSDCLTVNGIGVYRQTSCEMMRSFICKKEDTSQCPTIDTNYIYKNGKCYKISKQKQLFMEAASTCFNEGARLVTEISENIKELITDHTEYHMGGVKLPTGKIFSTRGMQLLQFEGGNEDFGCLKMRRYNDYRSGPINIYHSSCDSSLKYICVMDV